MHNELTVFTHCYYTEKYFLKTLIFFTFTSTCYSKTSSVDCKVLQKNRINILFQQTYHCFFLASTGRNWLFTIQYTLKEFDFGIVVF